MITHGKLANLLNTYLGKVLTPAIVGDILIATSEGVAAEGQIVIKPETLDMADATHLSTFKFGARSERELQGVRTELVQCVRLALAYSTVDFCVFDGVRTLVEQQANVAKGVSQTLHSAHLTGDAVDLVPTPSGIPKWDWALIYCVTLAMIQAARKLGFDHNIIWGGAWDRRLSDFTDPQTETRAYCERHAGKDFLDGPHFEWRT